MGLFENLGRKVGEFTHEASESAEDPTHACPDCGQEFYTDYETCPDCGSENVVALDD